MKGIFLHIIIILFAIFRIDFVCSSSLHGCANDNDLSSVVFVLEQQENSLLSNDFNSEYIYTETFIQSQSFRGNISNKIKTVFPFICYKKDCSLKSEVKLENKKLIYQDYLPLLSNGNKSMVLRL